MMETTLPRGSKIYFGLSAVPMHEVMVDAIGQVVAQVPDIVEAYLPQCFILGDEEAKQVLVVGILQKNRIPHAMKNLMEQLALVLPKGQFIDVIPFSVDDMPLDARISECQILNRFDVFQERIKPWWKFW